MSRKVVISVSGGVADVESQPDDVCVEIIDYDVEGSEDELEQDEDGNDCRISVFPAKK